jgi:hypothetical protein
MIHTKKDMMFYHVNKWYFSNNTIDCDIVNSLEEEIEIFKNNHTMYYLDNIICTMDLEDLFEAR